MGQKTRIGDNMVFWMPQCEILDDIIEICDKYQFEELDTDYEYMKIEFVGDYEYHSLEDFETRFDYYRVTEKICEEKIEPYFLQCWEELQSLNIFKDYEWDYDDYMCWYVYFTKEFENALKIYDIIDNDIYTIEKIKFSRYKQFINIDFVLWGHEGLVEDITDKINKLDYTIADASWNDEDGSYDVSCQIGVQTIKIPYK